MLGIYLCNITYCFFGGRCGIIAVGKGKKGASKNAKPLNNNGKEEIEMEKAKALNMKNMKETIVNYSGDQKEFDKIWDAFYQMALNGFISQDTWKKFFNQCAGWYVDEENACIRDGRHCPEGIASIVWKYTPDAEYKA